jgi:hypothetical protein
VAHLEKKGMGNFAREMKVLGENLPSWPLHQSEVPMNLPRIEHGYGYFLYIQTSFIVSTVKA